MKNLLKTLLITAILFSSMGYGFSASAEIIASNLKVKDIENNTATLTWRTNQDVRSIVYYGTEIDELDNRVTYDAYKKRHEVVLHGLEEDETYYYKIRLLPRSGSYLELFTQYFSTRDMIDDIDPRIEEAETVQTTADAAAISWVTNEPTKAEIYYKPADSTDDETKKTYNSLKEVHEFYIYKLQPGTEYYVRIIAKDESGNTDQTALHFYTYTTNVDSPSMSVYDIKPTSYDENLVSDTSVTIKFKTNLAAGAEIKYGLQPNRLNEKVILNDKLIDTSHEVTLTDLEPDTTYFYQIQTYRGLYGKSTRVLDLSFTTAPSPIEPTVLGIKETNEDSDNDGLTDSYELSIGTNPNSSDTDGDGYPDKLEIDNGYDPNGPGKLTKLIYNKPRLSNEVEMAKSIELKNALEDRLGSLNLDRNGWFTVVNAYIYGDYPIKAIAQAIKFGGKTVHPTIGWSAWQNSSDYLNYINK